jgi:hypothetical protein
MTLGPCSRLARRESSRKRKRCWRKDRRLVNAQYWYQFPLHLAVFTGHTELVRLLLQHGADPGQSIYTYNSWNKLLSCAQERGYRHISSLLQRAMQERFNYTPRFDVLKEAIIARDSRKVGTVLRRQPQLVRASDALGNNALHWSVITRQLSLLDRFVELGTPLDAQRADGQTPLLLAVNGATDYWYRETRRRSHPSLRNTSVLVGSLLAHGANYTLSVAAALGDQERVEQLLKRDVPAGQEPGFSPQNPAILRSWRGPSAYRPPFTRAWRRAERAGGFGSSRRGVVQCLLWQSHGGCAVLAGTRRQSERRHRFERMLPHD